MGRTPMSTIKMNKPTKGNHVVTLASPCVYLLQDQVHERATVPAPIVDEVAIQIRKLKIAVLLSQPHTADRLLYL